jgi:hypothetical protein
VSATQSVPADRDVLKGLVEKGLAQVVVIADPAL